VKLLKDTSEMSVDELWEVIDREGIQIHSFDDDEKEKH
jgi:predicted HTH domain antitoxin